MSVSSKTNTSTFLICFTCIMCRRSEVDRLRNGIPGQFQWRYGSELESVSASTRAVAAERVFRVSAAIPAPEPMRA